MRLRPALALPVAALVLAGCGSSPPSQSASAACKSFAAWLRAQDGNNLAGEAMSTLAQAVSSAPSGQLYQDLNTVKINVRNALAHPEYGPDLSIDGDVQAVQADCASVNTG